MERASQRDVVKVDQSETTDSSSCKHVRGMAPHSSDPHHDHKRPTNRLLPRFSKEQPVGGVKGVASARDEVELHRASVTLLNVGGFVCTM
jgi:hypothetical protein